MSDGKGDAAKPESANKIPLQVIRGLPFPGPHLVTTDIENAIDFKPQDSDIFVVTYPKCGTTWAQFIVWEILHKGAVPPSPNQMMFRDFPFLELTGVDLLEDMPAPRTMKTHLPFNLHPYNKRAKYIYIVRNPWDCCVSYYYYVKNFPTTPALSFDEFLESFITGEVGWGDYFDHVLSWFDHRNDPNVLFLTYEDMQKDKRKALLGIAKFLGNSYYEDIKREEVLQLCLKHSDFKYLKELGMFLPKPPTADMDAPGIKDMFHKMGEVDRETANDEEYREVNFFRKGEVGDWRNHFSPRHVKKFNEYMTRKLENTEMKNFWQPLMEETSL